MWWGKKEDEVEVTKATSGLIFGGGRGRGRGGGIHDSACRWGLNNE